MPRIPLAGISAPFSSAMAGAFRRVYIDRREREARRRAEEEAQMEREREATREQAAQQRRDAEIAAQRQWDLQLLNQRQDFAQQEAAAAREAQKAEAEKTRKAISDRQAATQEAIKQRFDEEQKRLVEQEQERRAAQAQELNQEVIQKQLEMEQESRDKEAERLDEERQQDIENRRAFVDDVRQAGKVATPQDYEKWKAKQLSIDDLPDDPQVVAKRENEQRKIAQALAKERRAVVEGWKPIIYPPEGKAIEDVPPAVSAFMRDFIAPATLRMVLDGASRQDVQRSLLDLIERYVKANNRATARAMVAANLDEWMTDLAKRKQEFDALKAK